MSWREGFVSGGVVTIAKRSPMRIVKQYGVTRGLDRSLLHTASRLSSKSRDDCAKDVEMSSSILLGRLSSRLCRDVLRERCVSFNASAKYAPERYLSAHCFSQARLKCNASSASCLPRWPAAGTQRIMPTYCRALSTSSEHPQSQPGPEEKEVCCPSAPVYEVELISCRDSMRLG